MDSLEEKYIKNNSYSFNFKKFRELKKKIKEFIIKKYWEDIVQKIFTNKEIKEAFYKHVLWFSWNTDVFNSWRRKDISEFDLNKTVEDVISDTKHYVMENLYK